MNKMLSYLALRSGGKLRGLRYIHGHGIHSPFVFSLITDVIEEKYGYYALEHIELIRRRMMRDEEYKPIIADEGLSHKDGSLLFRLANRFKPTNILHIGDTSGLPLLYTTSYAPNLKVCNIQGEDFCTEPARQLLKQEARHPVQMFEGDLVQQLQDVLEWFDRIDFIFVNSITGFHTLHTVVEHCLPLLHDKSVVVFNKINRDWKMYELWAELAGWKEVTLSVDLTRMGILFYDKKLHKRNYTLYY